MSVSYYDLLDVEPTASETEIRDAWRSAVDGLLPTDRRFRAYNKAAETLLDPAARAAYDDRLAREAASEAEEAEAADDRDTSATPAASAVAAPAAAAPTGPVEPADPVAEEDERTGATGASAVARVQSWTPPAWVVAAVAALALLLAGTAVWLAFQPSQDAIEAAAPQAQVAAENAVAPVLDYDAADLDASQERAHTYLTSGYREEYDKFFEGVVAQNAPELGTKVSTKVLASSVVSVDVDRAEVLLFIDQTATSKQDAQGKVFNNQVTLTMVDVDGTWLVDQLCTNQDDC